jgi:HD-GYP domain-containing protein (c-di-GMP phosphodiesterase class II)
MNYQPPQAMETSKAELEAFDPRLLSDGARTDFDIYLKVGGLTVLYAAAPYVWSLAEINRLQVEGHRKLFYRKDDAKRAIVQFKMVNLRPINKSLPPVERICQVTDLAAEFTRVLFNHELTPSAVEKATVIADALRECVEEDPGCVHVLNRLAEHDLYSYMHGARVAAYSLAIAIHQGETKTARLIQIALGALLHDVGNSKVDQKLLHKDGPLSPTEWSQVHQHPELGHAEVARVVLTAVPREIVLRHHEREDGSGYPHQLRSDELIHEVKIAAFADVFDALTSDRPHRKARTNYQALEFIKFSMIRGLHHDSYRSMVELLGTQKLKRA